VIYSTVASDMTHNDEGLRDVPFLANDMMEPNPTMGKPLDTVDEPGKADGELGLDPMEVES
jgi:hypothetical protein